MNTMHLQDLVKGSYGRKIAYTNVEEINESNIVKVVGDCIGVFNSNKPIIKYLWDYKNGDQPIRYRTKSIRDDVCNNIVENHAWEIVRFKNGQTFGEPVQLVSNSDDDKINEAVEELNRWLFKTHKQRKDLDSGEWTSAVGTGFKAIHIKSKNAIPFGIVVPTPMNTFIIYSRMTDEPMLAVQELYDENDERYFLCFTETHEYRIKDSKLQGLYTLDDGTVAYSRLHVFGGIPIVEYPNNQSRISDIELVIDMLDAINNFQSNRMDAVEQFVSSFIKFINCEIDEETFKQMKMNGAFVVKSNNGSDNKADVDIMSQELDQQQSQIAKQDLWDNVLSIEAIPSTQKGSDGGSTTGAVELRGGWDFSKTATRIKDAYVVEAETRLVDCVLNVIHATKGNNVLPITTMDFDVQITHSPTDNMYIKAEVFQMLVANGIHPLVAIKTCGLWTDAEKTYLLSKPYLDALYRTIDDVIAEQDMQAQVDRANQLIAQRNVQKGNE